MEYNLYVTKSAHAEPQEYYATLTPPLEDETAAQITEQLTKPLSRDEQDETARGLFHEARVATNTPAGTVLRILDARSHRNEMSTSEVVVGAFVASALSEVTGYYPTVFANGRQLNTQQHARASSAGRPSA